MTKICEETAELLKDAIVTVASGVAKPLEWESDCASTLRQLTQVLGLMGTMREKLHAEGLQESRCGGTRPASDKSAATDP